MLFSEKESYFCVIKSPMQKSPKRIEIKVPEPTLRRLPWYLAYLKLLKNKEVSYISSTQVAKEINVAPAQIAKDLSHIGITGKTRMGYDVNALAKTLEDFLGFSTGHNAFLFGVGSLGAALLHDSGLVGYGLNILAGFDIKKDIIGTAINNIRVFDFSDFTEIQQRYNVPVGVLTVPVDKAQDVADQMIAGGIKAIWNFTPFRIRVPEHIVVQNTSIYAHLAVMFNRLG